uniref:Coatomer subunit zeta n=1 Tax=Eimeria tenella TaxID=5802 RepID=H9B9Z5_EIMTE|nr:hypothetical protein [Eimeria tenella]
MSRNCSRSGTMDTPLRLTCLCILDSNGERICAQYPTRAPPSLGPPCPYRDFDSQRKFEGLLHQGLMNIRGRTDAEALQVEGEVAVGLDVGDVSIFAVSPESSANELLLLEVVEALRSVLSSICNGTVTRQALLENMDSVLLAMDETADQGLPPETNPSAILARINMQGDGQGTQETTASLNQAISQAKDSIIKSLLSGAS